MSSYDRQRRIGLSYKGRKGPVVKGPGSFGSGGPSGKSFQETCGPIRPEKSQKDSHRRRIRGLHRLSQHDRSQIRTQGPSMARYVHQTQGTGGEAAPGGFSGGLVRRDRRGTGPQTTHRPGRPVGGHIGTDRSQRSELQDGELSETDSQRHARRYKTGDNNHPLPHSRREPSPGHGSSGPQRRKSSTDSPIPKRPDSGRARSEILLPGAYEYGDRDSSVFRRTASRQDHDGRR